MYLIFALQQADRPFFRENELHRVLGPCKSDGKKFRPIYKGLPCPHISFALIPPQARRLKNQLKKV